MLLNSQLKSGSDSLESANKSAAANFEGGVGAAVEREVADTTAVETEVAKIDLAPQLNFDESPPSLGETTRPKEQSLPQVQVDAGTLESLPDDHQIHIKNLEALIESSDTEIVTDAHSIMENALDGPGKIEN